MNLIVSALRITVVSLALTSTSTASSAGNNDDEGPAIYRSRDAAGNTVFSDQPSRDAERVELKDTNRTPAVQPKPRPNKKATKDNTANAYRVHITEPADGQFFANGLQGTPVAVNVHPPLLPKHNVEFLLNGERIAIGSSFRTRITRLKPGAHQISARIVDEQGKTLGTPASVQVTAQWPGKR